MGENNLNKATYTNLQPIKSIVYDLSETVTGCIRAKVILKTIQRRYERGGRCASFDLADENGKICLVMFNEQIDRFYDMLQVNEIYYINKAEINRAEFRVYGDVEIIARDFTSIVSSNIIPNFGWNFHPLELVNELPLNSVIDIIGFCTDEKEFVDFTGLTQYENKTMKELFITNGKTEVILTLWNEDAEYVEREGIIGKVIAVKHARINEYEDKKKFSTIYRSFVQVNPNIPVAHKLREACSKQQLI